MSSETFKTPERNNLEKLYNLDLPKEPETINQESIENNLIIIIIK
jgi:hypothetical protein